MRQNETSLFLTFYGKKFVFKKAKIQTLEIEKSVLWLTFISHCQCILLPTSTFRNFFDKKTKNHNFKPPVYLDVPRYSPLSFLATLFKTKDFCTSKE